MKTHLLCIGPGYWILKKLEKKIIAKKDLETSTEEERELFMCEMRAREALLIALSEIEYNQVKSLVTSHLIWKALENSFEGDEHSKKLRLQNWTCVFQDAKMMEDESIRTYIGRISEIIIDIKSQRGTEDDDEVIWKILKTLIPPFKSTVQMIQLLISCTKDFTKETFLGRLEVVDNELR